MVRRRRGCRRATRLLPIAPLLLEARRLRRVNGSTVHTHTERGSAVSAGHRHPTGDERPFRDRDRLRLDVREHARLGAQLQPAARRHVAVDLAVDDGVLRADRAGHLAALGRP
jgi:hypothetical protein